eukprot:182997_1
MIQHSWTARLNQPRDVCPVARKISPSRSIRVLPVSCIIVSISHHMQKYDHSNRLHRSTSIVHGEFNQYRANVFWEYATCIRTITFTLFIVLCWLNHGIYTSHTIAVDMNNKEKKQLEQEQNSN